MPLRTIKVTVVVLTCTNKSSNALLFGQILLSMNLSEYCSGGFPSPKKLKSPDIFLSDLGIR